MLRQMNNEDRFQLYASDLVLRLHNTKKLADTRKILTRFKEYLGAYPPSPELAKSFLAQYTDRKPRTLYRYAQMLRVFMKWYGEPINDLKVGIPKTLPRRFANSLRPIPVFKASSTNKLSLTIQPLCDFLFSIA